VLRWGGGEEGEEEARRHPRMSGREEVDTCNTRAMRTPAV